MILANRGVPKTYKWYHGRDVYMEIVAPPNTGPYEVLAVIRRIGDPEQGVLVTLDVTLDEFAVILTKSADDLAFLRKGKYELSIEFQRSANISSVPSPYADNVRGFFIVEDEIETITTASGWVVAVPISPTEIDVSWAPAPGATSYELERSLDQTTWVPVYAGSLTTFNDTGLVTALTYYYRVKVLRAGYPDSVWTHAVATTPSSGSGLISVYRYTESVGGTVTWNVPALIGSAPIIAFRGVSGEFDIILSGTPVNDELLINTGTGDVYVDAALPLQVGERITIVYTPAS